MLSLLPMPKVSMLPAASPRSLVSLPGLSWRKLVQWCSRTHGSSQVSRPD